MAQGRKVISLIPTVKGVHKGMPANAAPDLTAPDLRNVLGISTLEQKRTLAKRDGTVKAFRNAAGGGGGSRITGLGTALRAAGQTQEQAGVYVPFLEAWAGYPYPYQANFSGFFTTADLLGQWIRYSKKGTDYGANAYQGGATLPGEWIGAVRGGGYPDHLQLRSTFGTYDNIGVVRAWDGGNDLTVTQDCYPRAGAVDFVHCTNFGPAIRGHPAFGYFVWAYLARQSENVVRLRIEGVRGNATETLAESADLTLSGGATRSDNCQIHLEGTSVALRATLTWPDVFGTTQTTVGVASTFGVKTAWVEFTGAAGTFIAGEEVTQATSGAKGRVLQRVQSAAAGYLQVYVTSGTFDGTHGLTGGTSGATATAARVSTINNARCGVNWRNPGTSVPGSENGFYYRRCIQAGGSDRRITDPEVIAEALGSFQMQGGRYQIPPNWESYLVDGNAGQVTRIYAGQAGYSSNTRPGAPCIDTTNHYVLDGDATASSTASRFKRTSIMTIDLWGSTPPTENYQLRGKLRAVTSGEDNGFGFGFMFKNLH